LNEGDTELNPKVKRMPQKTPKRIEDCRQSKVAK